MWFTETANRIGLITLNGYVSERERTGIGCGAGRAARAGWRGSFWVFHTGLTDLQYTMTVTDTVTGAVKTYQNDRSDPARLCGGSDTRAFP